LDGGVRRLQRGGIATWIAPCAGNLSLLQRFAILGTTRCEPKPAATCFRQSAGLPDAEGPVAQNGQRGRVCVSEEGDVYGMRQGVGHVWV